MDNPQDILDQVVNAASKYPRCCDVWQDGLGGMHCQACSQKTFAMMYKIQEILDMDKSGNPKG